MRVINLPEGLCEEAQGSIALRLTARHSDLCSSKDTVLTRRTTRGGAVYIQIQCTGCGAPFGGALKREHHPDAEQYPEFDAEKQDLFNEEMYRKASEALRARREEAEAQRRARLANKEEFYQSAVWQRMRAHVMERAKSTCEACGWRLADTVHHTTYRFGLRAPLYTLRALCNQCHRRMHTQNDEWHDPDLPAHYIYGDDE